MNFSGIETFLVTVVGILVIVVGAKIIGKSDKAQFSDVAKTSANTVIGMVFVVVGLGAVAWQFIGEYVAILFFNG